MKPASNSHRKRVLAAIDLDPFNDDIDHGREELNRQILEHAVDMAQLEDAELHVVHAWKFHLEQRVQNRAGIPSDIVAELRQAVRQLHYDALTQFLVPYRPRIKHVHLLKGSAADQIVRLAKSESVDTLVMGNVRRTGIARWLFGNTAETIFSRVECSLVTLTPRTECERSAACERRAVNMDLKTPRLNGYWGLSWNPGSRLEVPKCPVDTPRASVTCSIPPNAGRIEPYSDDSGGRR